jgi:thioredoxin-like negative regulator of GroEL
MAPVVHGLEQQYAGRVDFLYLNVADTANVRAKAALGFKATPHFFFLRADGSPVRTMRGVLPADSLRGALEEILAASPAASR